MRKKAYQRVTAVMIAAALAIGCTACGGSSSSTSTAATTSEAASDADASAVDSTGATTDTAESSDEEVITNSISEPESRYAHSATTKHDEIVIAEDGDPGNLLPLDQQTSGKDEVCDMVFERLYVIDGFGGDLLPCVAEDLPTDAGVDDSTGDYMYDIKIRENVYDSDGNNITASDVAYSYDWLVTNSTPQNMGKYHSAEAVDDYTVRFYCDELNGVSDYGNLFAQQWVFSQKAEEEHDFATDPVGSAPYKVLSITEGAEYAFEARDDYWAEGEDYQINTANVQTVRYKIMGEASQQANALRTGEVDYSKSVPETDRDDFLNDGQYASDYSVYAYLENLTFYLLPNCDSSSICSNEDFRMAMMYAIDGNTAALASGNSSAEMVYDLYNSKFPETKESWKTEDNYYSNASLETAKEYLEKSGYNGEEVVFMTTDAPIQAQNVSTVAATILQGIGVNVDLQVVSSNIANTTMSDPTTWDLTIGMMASDDYGVVDVARLMSKDSYGEGRDTMNFITDDTLQELVTTCNTVEGHTDENVQELHDYIIENAYGRGLFAAKTYNIVTSDVTELAMNYKYNIVPGKCIFADNEF